MIPDGEWVAVSSSNVEAARRVGDALEVRFHPSRIPLRGRTWRYEGAGQMLEPLLVAPSAGKFVRWTLRPAYGDGVEVT